MTEILAPAGSRDALEAAVRAGADAVYLGLKKFNARRNADNFSNEDLSAIVSYCHSRGVKVHITLNTLVFDNELEEAFETAAFAAKCGVDAVIVQDIGLARLIKNYIPDLSLHASTQMSVHNTSGAEAVSNMGFSRVVLARELSKKEIDAINEGVPQIETEIFVHGALCMSVSGQCYISALLGSRSGNRGLCAQACRLDFTCGNRDYALSLKDLSLIDGINGMNVNSLKIEGRMKRPEYVAAAVYMCRKARDGGQLDNDEKELLRAAFSRSGFTDNYYTNNLSPDMFGHRTKADTENSNEAYGKINSLIRHEFARIPVNMQFFAKTGEYIRLTAFDGDYSVTLTGTLAEKARSKPTDGARIEDNLKKTGNTPFFVNNISVDISPDAAIAMSAINELRRNVLSALSKKRGQPVSYQVQTPIIPQNTAKSGYSQKLHLRFARFDQIPFEAISDKDVLILPLDEIVAHKQELKNVPIIAELPRLIFDEEKLNCDIKNSGISEVLCGNIGAINFAVKHNLTVHGDFGLNITNISTLSYFRELKLKSTTLSFELTLPRIKKLCGEDIGIIAYGRLPLMLTRACIKAGGLCVNCSKSGSIFELKDRKNEIFPVVCHGGYNEVLNCRTLYLADRLNELNGIGFLKLYFTDENIETVRKIINEYRCGGNPEGLFTRGLIFRGVM